LALGVQYGPSRHCSRGLESSIYQALLEIVAAATNKR
jgi:hypothetical protein